MTTTSTSNSASNRASLLAGLRTGGVRSTSSGAGPGLPAIPHTAAPGGSFPTHSVNHYHHQPARYTPTTNYNNHQNQNHFASHFPEEEEEDEHEHAGAYYHHNNNNNTSAYGQQQQQHSYNNLNMGGGGLPRAPMTAAVDGHNNRFAQQQQSDALQFQMMQLEIMRLQSQYLAQAQLIQQQQQQQGSAVGGGGGGIRRTASSSHTTNHINGYAPPLTAGPLSTSFTQPGVPPNTGALPPHLLQRRANLSGGDTEYGNVPMTAALGGKFGARNMSMNMGGRFGSDDDSSSPSSGVGTTTVISGGTSLGNNNNNNNNNNGVPATPSKSDMATSWRRGGNNNSVLSGNNQRAVSSPLGGMSRSGSRTATSPSPPLDGRKSASPSPPLSTTTNAVPKFRPQPLRFAAAQSPSLQSNGAANISDEIGTTVILDATSSSSPSSSSPRSPVGSSSPGTLSPREEASKKLYEGLGLGLRPLSISDANGGGVPQIVVSASVSPIATVPSSSLPLSIPTSHSTNYSSTTAIASSSSSSPPKYVNLFYPTRQPRGPPSGAEELGPKNFATRIRRKAIGGLEVLMGNRVQGGVGVEVC